MLRVRSRRERRAGPVFVVDSLTVRIFQHQSSIESGAAGLQCDIIGCLKPRGAALEQASRCGEIDIVRDRHRRRDFSIGLLDDPEIPPLQPGLAMLGGRECREDAANHHHPVIVEIAGLYAIGHADLRAIQLLVPGGLVDDRQDAPAEFRQQRHLEIAILQHLCPELAIDDRPSRPASRPRNRCSRRSKYLTVCSMSSWIHRATHGRHLAHAPQPCKAQADSSAASRNRPSSTAVR